MKWILPAYSAVQKICGIQKYDPKRDYRLSAHCIQVLCEEGTLLFHTLLGSLLMVQRGESLSDLQKELVSARYMVPFGTDEIRYTDTVRQLLSTVQPKQNKKTGFTILTTTDCNARCFYCYEIGRRRFSMTSAIAHDVAAYISEACRGHEVSIHWFGGEPLYNVSAIDIICENLIKSGISFKSRMTSNGFYLDRATAQRAVCKWHMQSAQITLDGTEEIYNQTKRYVSFLDNGFERVMHNIDEALKAGIRVVIRMNMDARNAADLSELCDQLAERFHNRQGLTAYPVLLKQFSGDIHSFATEDEAIQWYHILVEKIKDNGMGRKHPLQREISANRCMADNDNCEVILPDGRIGRCEHFSETEIVGSIYDGSRDEMLIHAWKKRMEAFPECRDCVLYPRCINLERCDWMKDGCPKHIRIVRENRLKEQILNAYMEMAGKEETDESTA